jgi:hypothetical protein
MNFQIQLRANKQELNPNARRNKAKAPQALSKPVKQKITSQLNISPALPRQPKRTEPST